MSPATDSNGSKTTLLMIWFRSKYCNFSLRLFSRRRCLTEEFHFSDLSGNALSASVEDVVRPFSKHLSRLRSLSLASNNLRAIPSRSFHRLTALKRLDLSDNQLTTIQIDAFEGLELDELYVAFYDGARRDNDILFFKLIRQFAAFYFVSNRNFKSTLSDYFLSNLFFRLVNTSSLLCDCKLDWLSAWLKEWRLGSEGDFVCGHPEHLQNISLFDVNPVNMTCGKHLIDLKAEFIQSTLFDARKILLAVSYKIMKNFRLNG